MIALIIGSVTLIDGTNRARKSYSSKYLGIFMPIDSQVTDLAEIGTEARFFKMMLASEMGLGIGYAPKSIRAPSSIALCYPHVWPQCRTTRLADLGRIYNDNGQSRRREARRKHRLEATGGFDGDRHEQADVPFALPQIRFDQ